MSTSPHTCAHPCQPLHPPPKGLQPNPHSPPATTRPAFASLPSAVMGPKFLTQSHTISRLTLLHLHVPLTFQSIGQRGNSYRLPAARIPLRFARFSCTKPAIYAGAAAVNHPHHTNCVNHSSNKCQPALVRALLPEHNPFNPCTRRDTLPPSAKFFSESKKIHEFTRQIAPLRANLILTSRTDRITEQGIT